MKRKVAIQVDKTNTALPHWDLSLAFYKGLDDPQIETDKESLKRLSKELEMYRGLIAYLEPYQLSIVLHKYEEMIELSQKLSYFAFLYSDTHKTDEEATNFESKISEKLSGYFERLGFIHFELNNLYEYKMEEFLNHPKLARWVPWLKRLFNSYWTLNESAAFIIDKKSVVSSQWSRLYSETCAKMKFSLNGKSLNEAEISAKTSSPDPDVRKKAVKEMNRVFKNNAHIITMCYNMILKDKSTDDELWGLDEPVSESLSHNHICKEDLLAMSGEVVDSYIPISQRFFKLLAKMLKKDTISYEDRMINPIEGPKGKITWPDCVEQVMTAYGDFSLDYLNYAMTIINAGIIDVPPAKGKRSGAYCIRGKAPYILLNFTGCEGDVTAFAHELGHGVHHLLSAQIGTLNDSTPTALAEVASEFAENLKPFLETVKDIDDSMGEKIKILVAAILALTSAEITNGIASIFGGGNDFLTKFGEQLEGFAEHLVNFAKSISGDNQIDIDSVEIAMNALSMVADVASKLPNSGGLLGAIVGENDIGKFVEQLAGIGPILKDFSMDVQGINEKSIERAMDSLAKIAETAQKIPNTGGIWGGIVGENDIAPFVNQLAGIGPILKDFSMDVAGTNVKGIESAMDAIKTMAEAANEIPNTGGLAGFFAGENDLGDFIKQMKDVGPILTAFSYSVQGVDVAAISNAMDLVAVMSEFGHDELLHVGSFVSAIQMLSDEEFTTDLTAFGESISSFYDAIKGKVDEVEEILEKFGSMSSSLSSFISSMSQLGADFTNVFGASIDENKNGPVNSFAAILSDMLTKGNEKKRDFEILGIDLVQSFITGTDAQKQPSIDKYADILDWIAKYIESQNDDFKTLGETLATKFGEGIKNKKRDVLSESNKICDAIIAAIKSYYNDTKDAGKYLMDGLIKGIGDKTEEVRQATKDISRAALNTMQTTLDEHSPSTITTDFGENFGQGFVNGIYRLIPIAEQASNRLAFSGLNAVSTAIGIISDEIGDDPIQPVISPVLDMSRLQNQKHLLADMFSEDTAVSVIDSLPVDRDGMIKIQNQNEQSSVVSELRSLRRDMGDMTSKMSRLQVVMDSGQLVGAISHQMDNAFGDISTRKGRWN